MPRLTLPEGKKVEAAFFDFNVTLKRRVVGEYGTDDLVTMQFRVPAESPTAVSLTATAAVVNALHSMLGTYEDVYGPVMGKPEEPVLGTDDTAREQTLVTVGGEMSPEDKQALDDLPF